MNDKTVIELARDCGINFHQAKWPELERFAGLVRAKERDSWPAEMEAMERQVNILSDELAKAKAEEREACAKVCEDSVEYAGDTLAAAIRARGQA